MGVHKPARLGAGFASHPTTSAPPARATGSAACPVRCEAGRSARDPPGAIPPNGRGIGGPGIGGRQVGHCGGRSNACVSAGLMAGWESSRSRRRRDRGNRGCGRSGGKRRRGLGERIVVRPARERALGTGFGGRRRRGTGRREGADGRQGAGERGDRARLIGLRLMVPRLVKRRLVAQGVPLADLGEARGQPGEEGGKLVDEGGGDHVCEHI